MDRCSRGALCVVDSRPLVSGGTSWVGRCWRLECSPNGVLSFSCRTVAEILKRQHGPPAAFQKELDRYERELLSTAESRQTVEFSRRSPRACPSLLVALARTSPAVIARGSSRSSGAVRMTRVAIIAAMPGELKPLVRGWPHSDPKRYPLLGAAQRRGRVDCRVCRSRASGRHPRLCRRLKRAVPSI